MKGLGVFILCVSMKCLRTRSLAGLWRSPLTNQRWALGSRDQSPPTTAHLTPPDLWTPGRKESEKEWTALDRGHELDRGGDMVYVCHLPAMSERATNMFLELSPNCVSSIPSSTEIEIYLYLINSIKYLQTYLQISFLHSTCNTLQGACRYLDIGTCKC